MKIGNEIEFKYAKPEETMFHADGFSAIAIVTLAFLGIVYLFQTFFKVFS